MNKRVFVAALICTLFFCITAHAAPTVFACEGPKDMCDQVMKLQQQLAAQKENAVDPAKMAQLVAVAGTLSVVLKMLISGALNWSSRFRLSPKAGARIRLGVIVAGLLSGLFANIGFGIPWWQAIIIVGGGPGAIAFHEILKLVPALNGKGPLPAPSPVESDKGV